MIRNARWAVGRPTKMHSVADLVGLSMIRNARRDTGAPTQTRKMAN